MKLSAGSDSQLSTRMSLNFFDTHAHLDYPDYAPDLTEVIARAQAAGIVKIISIGTSLSGSECAIRLAEKFPNVFAAVGWHPTEAEKAPTDFRPALRELAKHPKVVAIGETGLDYHHLPETDAAKYKQRQAEIFHRQRRSNVAPEPAARPSFESSPT